MGRNAQLKPERNFCEVLSSVAISAQRKPSAVFEHLIELPKALV
jgi:hypothetical protein